MIEQSPLISVIVPVLNGEAYLAEAIDSIRAQTWPNIEIVVVDDGSTDGTAALVKRSYPEVRYVYQDNAGIGAARNHGLDVARGAYVAFLDADDIWLPDKLERQMRVFAEQPEVDMVFGHIRQFHSPDLTESERDKLHCPDGLMPAELPSTMLCRKALFDEVGPFESRWKVGQDVAWIMRAREFTRKSVMLPELLYLRRLHRNNNGNTRSEDFGDRLRIIKAMLDRKRGHAGS